MQSVGSNESDSPVLSCDIAAHILREALTVTSGWHLGLRLSQVADRMCLGSARSTVVSICFQVEW